MTDTAQVPRARPVARFMRTIAAPASAVGAGAVAVARHLVLAYRPGWQSLSDLAAIERHVRDIDRTIATFVVPTTSRSSATRKLAAARPSLVVSPGPIQTFRPLRGKVYQGSTMPKDEEVRRLVEGGVPVPKTALLTPDLVLDPAEWGEFVIVKPTDLITSSHGIGIVLMRTARVRYIAPRDYPPGHPGRRGPMLVQQFIDTGPEIKTYRVLTLFGEPLYAQLNIGDANPFRRDADDTTLERAPVALQAANTRRAVLVKEPDVLALARAAHAALPEIPLKGCDLLREAGSGRLWVIELNSGGNTWHFSSRYGQRLLRSLGHEFATARRRQFDALRTAARVLVERTNAEAE
jgi:hypothetical protein